MLGPPGSHSSRTCNRAPSPDQIPECTPARTLKHTDGPCNRLPVAHSADLAQGHRLDSEKLGSGFTFKKLNNNNNKNRTTQIQEEDICKKVQTNKIENKLLVYKCSSKILSLSQCCGSGSVCNWASRVRIRIRQIVTDSDHPVVKKKRSRVSDPH